ncbi:pre-rRNA-processing protein TSR2 homolog [Aethina tumida]|uniref:pre-rRNA-processing protein TSR2 homolog n=1 Tax=Aethina tumida TaxID=116153 RepID=UPI00096AF3A7|nr:pre-rRNA-processing protein TSR2 homolog [Aethina tumida]
MEDQFTKIVEHVFNNWTGLKLAVEHSMGGPNSKQTATDCLNYMVQYCLYEPNVQVEDIQEALEDIMDEEFDTVCEDGSPREIAHVLFKFLELLKQGNTEQFEAEFQSLPSSNQAWIHSQSAPPPPVSNTVYFPEEKAGPSTDVPMEEDSEWTEVRTRRKR